MGGGRTAKKRSKAARRTSAAASRVAKAEQAELALQPEPEPAAAGFGALPLPRAMVTCDSSYRGTPELRVVTYNILAQTYFQSNPRQQATCPPGNRGQKARHTMLMDELDNLIGDVGGSGTGTAVICMQEVEASYLDMLLRPALESRGYTVLFLRKVGGKNPGDAYRQLEGIAIAWRGAAELVEHKEVDLDQAVLDAASLPGDGYLVAGGGSENLGWSEPTRTHHEACAAALPYRPGSVALIARIRNPATGAELAIGTVHIYWNWKRHDIQTLQARITADQLLEMAARSKVDCPTVLCGDFNAQPNSTLYTLLHRGSLSNKQLNMLRPPATPQLFDAVRAASGYGPLVDIRAKPSAAKARSTAKARFSSAYLTATATEPRTNFTSYFSACLDYIWFTDLDVSRAGINLRGVLKVPRTDAFKRNRLNGCPNELCPSDHLSLMADFDWHINMTPRSDKASGDTNGADEEVPDSSSVKDGENMEGISAADSSDSGSGTSGAEISERLEEEVEHEDEAAWFGTFLKAFPWF